MIRAITLAVRALLQWWYETGANVAQKIAALAGYLGDRKVTYSSCQDWGEYFKRARAGLFDWHGH